AAAALVRLGLGRAPGFAARSVIRPDWVPDAGPVRPADLPGAGSPAAAGTSARPAAAATSAPTPTAGPAAVPEPAVGVAVHVGPAAALDVPVGGVVRAADPVPAGSR